MRLYCSSLLLLPVLISAHTTNGFRRPGINITDIRLPGLSTPKIDVHTHPYPDFYNEALTAAGVTSPTGDDSSSGVAWSVDMHLNFMATNNIQKSYLSCSSPGTVLYPNDTAVGIELTQRFNNFSAGLKKQYPDKFGFFATLPLPDIDASIKEISRALDELHADGFVFYSNYYGIYLGDSKLAPVYEKLHARKATIFIHPTSPCLQTTPTNLSAAAREPYEVPLADSYSVIMIEFLYDTTRAVMDILLTGTVDTYYNIKWIMPHGGSALPSVIDRFLSINQLLVAINAPGTRKRVPYTLQAATALLQRHFWFDLASFPVHNQIYNMLRFVGADRFLYGSDMPATPPFFATLLVGEMNATLPTIFSNEQIGMIFRDNALKLLGC